MTEAVEKSEAHLIETEEVDEEAKTPPFAYSAVSPAKVENAEVERPCASYRARTKRLQ